MPLDQAPNREASNMFHSLKTDTQLMTSLAALDCAHAAWDHGYIKKYMVSGFNDIGVE